MATVTGVTAEKMYEILDGTIESAAIDGSGHLILFKHDGSQVDAGSVIGPRGLTGPATEFINDIGDVDTVTQAPEVGDTLMWNGTNWVPGVNILVQGTAPTAPDVGDLWVDTSS